MIDYKSKYTPRGYAQDLIDLAEITSECTLLEPSAGSGSIIKQVHVRRPHIPATAVEVNSTEIAYLKSMSNVTVIHQDFLDYPVENKFDRVIANPPFTNDLWFFHLIKMYEHVNDGGLLVCIIPKWPIKKYNTPLISMITAMKLSFIGMTTHPMKNWAVNKNGSVTEIEVIKWRK